MPQQISDTLREKIHSLIKNECVNSASPGIDVIDRLIDMGRFVSLQRGEVLVREGSYNPNFYLLIEGVMRKWYWDNQNEITSCFATAGTQTLIYHCYYAGIPSTETIEACCKCLLMTVSKKDYDHLLSTSHAFALYNFEMAACDLYFNEKKRKLYTGSAMERYKAMLENRKEIVLKVPQRILASYLGITPQYLSVIRRKLR